MQLQKYWFVFDQSQPLPPGLKMGCGITAHSLKDAYLMLERHVFNGYDYHNPIESKELVDLNHLDKNHAAPNIGNPECRGVWFPLGYE